VEPDATYYWDGPLPETQAPSSTPEPWGETTVVGKPIMRVDAYDRVSGSAVYPSDVVLPDMLHAVVLSCPHAHAMVKRVDTSAAEKMPGVQAVLKDGVTGTNIPWFGGRGGFASRLFDSHCRYHGDEVAVVAADTVYQAWDAVRAITVEYEVLANAVTVEEAVKPTAPAIRDGGNMPAPPPPYKRGDVALGFKAADVVLEHTFQTPCELHNPMELHGCVAKWDGNRLTVWESTQGVYAVQAGVARALNLPLAGPLATMWAAVSEANSRRASTAPWPRCWRSGPGARFGCSSAANRSACPWGTDRRTALPSRPACRRTGRSSRSSPR
jgi:xanthine dehydrogenase molybdopterin-binding subunit B